MASIDTGGDGGGHKKGPGVKKAKKLSTNVDMTPMVDLGFLLITFFIFTATMSTPSTMRLTMPKDDNKPEDLTEVKQSAALTIMMGKDNQIFYYEGQLAPDGANFKSSTYKDIRQVVLDKKKSVIANHRHDTGCEKIWEKNKGDRNSCKDKDFVVIIKPNDEASYKNSVDILDEMAINDVQRFALIDITPQENQFVNASGGPAPASK
jgi:biopolymer transport protein ExbD